MHSFTVVKACAMADFSASWVRGCPFAYADSSISGGSAGLSGRVAGIRSIVRR